MNDQPLIAWNDEPRRPFRWFRFHFSVGALLFFVLLFSCGFAFVQRWYRSPMRTSVIYHAICYASDWNKLVESKPPMRQGEFSAFSFEVTKPGDLFKDVATQPELWGKTLIGDYPEVLYPDADEKSKRRANPRPVLPVQVFRQRFPSNPVSVIGMTIPQSPELIIDSCRMTGDCEKLSLPPRRFEISLKVDLTTQSYFNPPTTYFPGTSMRLPGFRDVVPPSQHRLEYSGTVKGNLIVFAKPIEDGLVRLILIELR